MSAVQGHSSWGNVLGSLFRCRRSSSASHEQGEQLERVLGLTDLLLFGLGNIVGSGIFILFGAAAQTAGPAVVLSFAMTGVAACCTAACYAELASLVPDAGSSYSFTYRETGELFAWLVGWSMVAECVLGFAATAVGWGDYTRNFLLGAGVQVPSFIQRWNPGDVVLIDPLALGFLVVVTSIVAIGIRETKMLNHTATCAKLFALALVVAFALPQQDLGNWTDFAPNGAKGIAESAALVMFAYSGFGVICNTAEEAKEPSWMLPASIMGSVGLSTAVYMVVSASVTLMVPWREIDLQAPLATPFAERPRLSTLISSCAVVGLFAIGVGTLLAASRVLMTLSRDGLLPTWIGAVSESSKTPVVATCLCGGLAVILTLLFPYEIITPMVSVATMFAFIMVCVNVVLARGSRTSAAAAGGGGGGAAASLDGQLPADRALLVPVLLVLYVGACVMGTKLVEQQQLRRGAVTAASALVLALAIHGLAGSRHPPKPPGTFQVPFGCVVPLAGVAMNASMMVSLGTALYFTASWSCVGLAIYGLYGWRHSKLGLGSEAWPIAAGAAA